MLVLLIIVYTCVLMCEWGAKNYILNEIHNNKNDHPYNCTSDLLVSQWMSETKYKTSGSRDCFVWVNQNYDTPEFIK